MADDDLESRRGEAAQWFTRLNQRRVSYADVEGFSAWRKDPLNAAAYSKVEELWRLSQSLAGDPDIAALIAQADANGAKPAKARTRSRPGFGPLPAIGIVVAIVAVSLVWFLNRPLSYETAVGERRTVELAD